MSQNRPPTPLATAPPTTADGYGEDHGALIDQEKLPDGTFVQRYEDGTEYHYPPGTYVLDDGTNDAGGEYDANGYTAPPPMAAAAGTNPMQEFYGDQYMHPQLSAAQRSVEMAAVPNGTKSAMAPSDDRPQPPPPTLESGAAEAGPSSNTADAMAPQISGDENVPQTDLPTSGYWIIDTMSEAFFSLAFRLWACLLFLNTFMLFLFYGLDYLFATQYRMIAPPTSYSGSIYWDTFAFGSLFLVLSFFIVTMLRMLIDVMREIFTARKTDHVLFGITLSASHPPYIIHVVMVVVLVIVPLLWALILSTSSDRPFAYFVQFLLFTSTVIAIFVAFVLYAILWVNSFRMKTIVYRDRDAEKRQINEYRHRHPSRGQPATSQRQDAPESSDTESDGASDEDDEERRRRRRRRRERKQQRRERRNRDNAGTGTHTTVVAPSGRTMAPPWYTSERTLREFGLNIKTVRWMMLVFAVGWMPVQVVSVVYAFSGESPTWSVLWIIIAFVVILSFMVMGESNTRFSARTATFINIFMIAVYWFIGVLSCAISGDADLIGIFIVLLIATQGLFLPKRPYEMQRYEIDAAFGPSVEVTGTENPVDSYLVPCRNTLFEFFRFADCIDIYGIFGRKNPKVSAREKEYRKENFALITDMRILMYYWFLLWLAMVIALPLGAEFDPPYFGDFARGPSNSPVLTNATVYQFGNIAELCKIDWNGWRYTAYEVANMSEILNTPKTKFNFSALDLALMGAIANSNGESETSALSTWFTGPMPQIIISNGGTTGGIGRNYIKWIDFYDNITDFHVIYVDSMTQGTSWMRAIDAYAEDFALDMAGAFAPFINVWPRTAKDQFVNSASFLKQWYLGTITDYYAELETYAIASAATGSVVMAGHGFDGAIARIIGQRNGIPSFTMDTPGTRWTRTLFGAPYPSEPQMHHVIVSNCDAWQMIDSLGGDVTVHYIPSNLGYEGYHYPVCSEPYNAIVDVLNVCGDPYLGRYMN